VEVTARDRWKLLGREAEEDPVPVVGLAGPGGTQFFASVVGISAER